MVCRIACFVLSFTFVSAQLPSLGFCPQYDPMEKFDIDRFLGKWYDAERYFSLNSISSKCAVTKYSKSDSGDYYVTNEYINVLTGAKYSVNGRIQALDEDGRGKLEVKYSLVLPSLPRRSSFDVLDTDYENYAVVWNCNGVGLLQTTNALVLTREQLPSGKVLQKAHAVLNKFHISRLFFTNTDQVNCPDKVPDLDEVKDPVEEIITTKAPQKKNNKNPKKQQR